VGNGEVLVAVGRVDGEPLPGAGVGDDRASAGSSRTDDTFSKRLTSAAWSADDSRNRTFAVGKNSARLAAPGTM